MKRREPKGNATYGFFPLWNPHSSLGSEPTNRNHEDRVPAPPPVAGSGVDARTVLAGKGPLRRAKNRRALAGLRAVLAGGRCDGRLRREHDRARDLVTKPVTG
jgi:hypothetical protein